MLGSSSGKRKKLQWEQLEVDFGWPPHPKSQWGCRDVVEPNLVQNFLTVPPLVLDQLRGGKKSNGQDSAKYNLQTTLSRPLSGQTKHIRVQIKENKTALFFLHCFLAPCGDRIWERNKAAAGWDPPLFQRQFLLVLGLPHCGTTVWLYLHK